jgi:hypothetical protein
MDIRQHPLPYTVRDARAARRHSLEARLRDFSHRLPPWATGFRGRPKVGVNGVIAYPVAQRGFYDPCMQEPNI